MGIRSEEVDGNCLLGVATEFFGIVGKSRLEEGFEVFGLEGSLLFFSSKRNEH